MHESPSSRRNFFKTLIAGSVAGASIMAMQPSQVLAGNDNNEGDIELKDVPAKVRSAADKAVPGAKWSDASKDDEDGEIIYTLEGTDSKGRDVSVDITAAGEVEEVDTEIPLDEVPPAVTAALKEKKPKFKATGVTELRIDGVVDAYEFEGRRPKDEEDVVIYVSADGKTIELED